MIRYILGRIDTGSQSASEIIKDATILKVMEWIQTSWAEVSENTIKNCFDKCGFGEPDVVADETVDNKFDDLLQELCSEATIEKFDDCVDACEPVMNTLSVYWTQE